MPKTTECVLKSLKDVEAKVINGKASKLSQKRNLNLDLIRCVAIFFVISVHFLLNTSFYATAVYSKKMYLLILFRVIFISCVPLFMMLTGYLMSKKEPTKEYYKKISKVVATYVICSILCILFKMLYKSQAFSFSNIVSSILDFSACNYAWYIEMYLGLYVIIPFLNKVYNVCIDKKEKQLLIIAFVFLTIAPNTLNIYFKIIPSFWVQLYPITYYFVGAYLREYNPKVNKKKIMLLLAGLILVFGTFNYFHFYKKHFDFSAFAGEAGIETFIIAILIFCILMNLDLKKISKNTASLINKISELSLGMYLLSYIFDDIFYHCDLMKNAPTVIEQFKYYFMIVPVVFVCSAYASQIVEWTRLGLSWMWKKVYRRFKAVGSKQK